MRELGYSGIFWTLFSVRWELFCAVFVVVSLYVWINLRLAARNSGAFRARGSTSESALVTKLGIRIPQTFLNLAMGAVAAVGALFVAMIFYAHWDTYLRFRYGGSFGLSDPLFGVDAGFYVFRLPFYELLQDSLTALALITLVAVLVFYAYFGLAAVQPRQTGCRAGPRKLFHICPCCYSSWSPVGHGDFTWITTSFSIPLREWFMEPVIRRIM